MMQIKLLLSLSGFVFVFSFVGISAARATATFILPQLKSFQPKIRTRLERKFIRLDAIVVNNKDAESDNTSSSPIIAPLADLPMRRLKLPRMAAGREYVIVPLKINDQGPFDFMVDTGLTAELITPHLQQSLAIDNDGETIVEGLAAGGRMQEEKLVELSGLKLCSSEGDLSLPKLHAIVTDFEQEHMDPAHDPVEGMLGMEMLELFDVDFDFPAGRLRLWAPGTAAAVAERDRLVEIPSAVLNETLLLCIRVTSGKNEKDKRETSDQRAKPFKQPFIGIIDYGSSFSAVNWAAAELLDLPPKTNRFAYLGSPIILGVGIDNKPLPLLTKSVQFTFVGDATKQDENGRVLEFAKPPTEWNPWTPVTVGIGDLPIFDLVLGDEKTKFEGPAAIIGMDVLSQRRVVLETCRGSIQCSARRRRLFVSPE
uniref:Peptidase A2 domain-containing protein n=1 Tax=Attheya septentrionalis TaxID=420275 RepID=A0A7S2XSH0_9STRA|mmetsp:Transcript_471/g.787  ORF Transcript_471/g.787 Transcript_471/m.787 type:complete len:426 (+) Transcript_471:271-1548(+)|eukprot:CAMPEP_0198294846 /NCGR_PEP_ID=MMETSP1449-20131203/24678_1 /TAXON_ID=420275 /ORGANISM="Attheya septentrionalis, Strain CCMP2084" /LENGTH=425 /DNA_ID=CAMNT_0043994941 /DNA_START=256 /DNA_END=1533 /DNA_ORIENTATION=+